MTEGWLIAWPKAKRSTIHSSQLLLVSEANAPKGNEVTEPKAQRSKRTESKSSEAQTPRTAPKRKGLNEPLKAKAPSR